MSPLKCFVLLLLNHALLHLTFEKGLSERRTTPSCIIFDDDDDDDDDDG